MGRKTPRAAVIDAHVLIWWLGGRLSHFGRASRAFLEHVDNGRAIAVIPTIALAELLEAMHRGRVTLHEPLEALMQRLERTSSRYRVVPLDTDVVMQSRALFEIPERGDRLIAATALVHGLPLITRDPEIAAPGLDVVW
jgi:PIN domain nuclease of toxin-antitoxin system